MFPVNPREYACDKTGKFCIQSLPPQSVHQDCSTPLRFDHPAFPQNAEVVRQRGLGHIQSELPARLLAGFVKLPNDLQSYWVGKGMEYG